MKAKRIGLSILLLAIVGLIVYNIAGPADLLAGESSVYATPLSLLPPVIAITLALITKEVYTSLFIGVLTGALLYTNGSLERTMNTMLFNEDGSMVSKLADSGNVGILIFLVLLGIMVAMMNTAGGSAAFGRWASKHIKTRVGAQLATMALGVLIFVDDYFNCLTVGSVMRPVTDRHKISRAKLSYLIDATAAPVCIIAPISSWAAAVTSSVPEEAGINGFAVFLQTIPYNLYALLTLAMILFITFLKVDFGPMKKHEWNAIKGDLFTTPDRPYEETSDVQGNPNARVADLIIPVVVLIATCVFGMIYTGGFFEGTSFIDAFANSSASVGLVIGGFITLIFTFFYYMLRGVITFKEFSECIPEGFKAMVAPILILTLAWTLSGMTNLLGAKVYVSNIVSGSAQGFQGFLPMIVFLIAAFLAFATGTSWGTFGILIPIVSPVAQSIAPSLVVVSLAATLAGSIFGDHCSPISDTTILSSTGASCQHLDHVNSQMPYAALLAVCSLIGYAVIGFTGAIYLGLAVSVVLLVALLFVLHRSAVKKYGE